MRKFLLLAFLVSSILSFGQNSPEYAAHIAKAEALYNDSDYTASANAYSEAFRSNNWLGVVTDRYNAACSWALAGNIDSAFFNLQRIVNKGYYTNYSHITNDPDLKSLHGDPRWQPLLEKIKSDKEKAEANLDKDLVRRLDSIHEADQKYRLMIRDYESKYGRDSKEMQSLGDTIRTNDSLNLGKIKAILDQQGWPGTDVIGDQGSTTIWLVIQHADLKTQEKYLPMMREAVKNKKAAASQLAMLVDRIEMGNGRPQIYGSQISLKDGKSELYPIADEKNVNKRRAEVGLQPLEDYLRNFGIDYKIPE